MDKFAINTGMTDFILDLLDQHDVDLEEECVAIAFHDSVVVVELNDDGNIAVEVNAVGRVVGVPMNFVWEEEE